jgi:hypothetical protein
VSAAVEDWGELNTGKRTPSLFALNTDTWQVRCGQQACFKHLGKCSRMRTRVQVQFHEYVFTLSRSQVSAGLSWLQGGKSGSLPARSNAFSATCLSCCGGCHW